jgi:hypothetical protein
MRLGCSQGKAEDSLGKTFQTAHLSAFLFSPCDLLVMARICPARVHLNALGIIASVSNIRKGGLRR